MQMMRGIETAVRREKDAAIAAQAAGDDTLRQECQRNINALVKRYAEIAKASGNAEKRERMGVDGFRAVKAKPEQENGLTNGGRNGTIKKKDGASRAAEHAQNWSSASLAETVKKFGLDKVPAVNENGKIIYSKDGSNITVVYDTNGKYFRIQDKTVPPKKRSAYLDIDGKPAQNITDNGKTRGRSKDEFQRDTHFLNSDEKG